MAMTKNEEYEMMKVFRDIILAIKPMEFREKFDECELNSGKLDFDKSMAVLADNIREGMEDLNLSEDQMSDIYEARVTLHAPSSRQLDAGQYVWWLLERMSRRTPDELCRDMYKRMMEEADDDDY